MEDRWDHLIGEIVSNNLTTSFDDVLDCSSRANFRLVCKEWAKVTQNIWTFPMCLTIPYTYIGSGREKEHPTEIRNVSDLHHRQTICFNCKCSLSTNPNGFDCFPIPFQQGSFSESRIRKMFFMRPSKENNYNHVIICQVCMKTIGTKKAYTIAWKVTASTTITIERCLDDDDDDDDDSMMIVSTSL
jgi:hypothetical protein